MTRLELLTKVFSEFSGKPESELLAWAEKNMSEEERESMTKPVPDDQVENLLASFRADPASVIRTLARPLGGK